MINHYIKFATVVLLHMLFLIPQKMVAQNEFGVKGGSLYSNFKTDNNGLVFDFDWQSGYSLGAYYDMYKLLGPIDFQAELLYQRKGTIEKFLTGSSSGYFDDANASWRVNKKHLHYLTAPLLLSYSAFNLIDVYAGPELGILIGATGDNISVSDYNRFSLGMALGAAIQLGEKTKLDFRYSSDFLRVAEMGNVNPKNHAFSITIEQTLFEK